MSKPLTANVSSHSNRFCCRFFPVAGQDLYLVSGPVYKKVTIQMENGKDVVIKGAEKSAGDKYIKSASLNGKDLNKAWFRHSDIKEGAVLDFRMQPEPSGWGKTIPPQ